MRYFSMFSGVGGFELGIGGRGECVGFSEIDSYAIQTYMKNFKEHKNYGNATTINERELPDFDLLVGGFPCQAFSVAGKRRGFDDTRGTLFFDIARILKHKKPAHLVLENVQGLLSHDEGRTFQTIVGVLTELGYRVEWQLLNGKRWVPQNRVRVVIVGHLRERCGRKVLPITGENTTTLSDLIAVDHGKLVRRRTANTIDANYYKGLDNHQQRPRVLVGTLRTHKDGNGFREMKSGMAPTIPARARNDGSGQGVIMLKSATKSGFEEASAYDGINLGAANSKTRRGRVQKQAAQTLNTSGDVGVAIPVLTPDRLVKRQNGRRFKEDGEPSFTLNTQDRHGIHDGVRIRRLTPTECERLMGWPDGWTTGVSDTQRYKQCGNGIIAPMVDAVMEALEAQGCF